MWLTCSPFQLHHGSIGRRQHQGRRFAFGGGDRRIDVGIFPHHLPRGTRPDARRRPGPSRDADSSKTTLVFGYLQDRSLILWGTGGDRRLDEPFEVFLNVACSVGSALGWTGRGTNLRQPCRSSSRRMVLVFHLSSYLCLKRLLDLSRGGNEAGLRLGEKGRKASPALARASNTDGGVPPCLASPGQPHPAGSRPR